METETSFSFVDQPCPKAFPCSGRTTEDRLSWTAVLLVRPLGGFSPSLSSEGRIGLSFGAAFM
ncbi:MAG: hypothetical protein ACLPXM_09775, partial [Terriglobales bacterium]